MEIALVKPYCQSHSQQTQAADLRPEHVCAKARAIHEGIAISDMLYRPRGQLRLLYPSLSGFLYAPQSHAIHSSHPWRVCLRVLALHVKKSRVGDCQMGL